MNVAYRKRIWLAQAPPGVWSSGPAVIWDLGAQIAINKYREMGWHVSGPYDLSDTEGILEPDYDNRN